MIILAIESSCDETSIAVLKNGKLLSNVVHTQIKTHEKFGGVVPEIASREHVSLITLVLDKAIKDANIKLEDIDYIAVTEGPGLVGSLLVGINVASTLAFCLDKPLIGVNHMAGHIYANWLENDIKFPLLCLVISGGHTELVLMEDHLNFKVLGETLDDAVGEAYDKVARVINIGYPGGPVVDKFAHLGKEHYKLPKVYLNKNEYNFSFSGLKSAVINLAHNLKQRNEEVDAYDLCYAFQNSVTDVLVDKTINAMNEYNVKNILLAGGVAANQGLREKFKEKNIEIIYPSIKYCTDNAAMIAMCAYYQVLNNIGKRDISMNANPSLDL